MPTNYKFVIVTVARLGIAVAIIKSINHSLMLTVGLLFVFVVADLLDGMWARRHNADNRARRIADATTDAIAILSIGLYFVWSHPEFVILYIPLLIRDAIVYSFCSYLFLKEKTLLTGGYWHKYGSIAKAALFLSALSGNFTLASVVAFVTYTINYILMIDYFRGYISGSKQLRKDRIVKLL